MHEDQKIEEAKFFYSKMLKSREDRKPLEYYLSAFLSGARSVLQYAREESTTKQNGREWYDTIVAGSNVLKFFKSKRNANIHAIPVSTDAKISIHIRDRLIISDSPNGSPIVSKVTPANHKPSVTQTVSYGFDDWSGGEDVFDLCKMYLDELEAIVESGQKCGHLT